MTERLVKYSAARFQLLPYLLNEARKERDQARYYPIDRKIFGSVHYSLAARLGLRVETPGQQERFLAAINHPKIDDTRMEQFFSFKQIGERMTQFLVAEHVHFTYPSIAITDMRRMNELFLSQQTIGKISRAYGINAYYEYRKDTTEEMLDSTFALLGLMHQCNGLRAVREFLDVNLFKIQLVEALRNGSNPSMKLNLMMRRYRQPLVEHRLVAESGRDDEKSSVFAVNAYSGMNLLGQGLGCTLQAAKRNANQVAWQNLTLRADPNPHFPSTCASWKSNFSSFLP